MPRSASAARGGPSGSPNCDANGNPDRNPERNPERNLGLLGNLGHLGDLGNLGNLRLSHAASHPARLMGDAPRHGVLLSAGKREGNQRSLAEPRRVLGV